MQPIALLKQRFFLFTGLLFAAIPGIGQELSIAAGPSFPLGSFSAVNWQGDYGGFAKVGEQLSVSYIYQLTNGFGLNAILLGRRNPVNTHTLAAQPVSGVAWMNGEPPPTPIHYKGHWKADHRDWWTGSLLIGGSKYLILSPDRRLSIILQAAAGIAFVEMPELKGKMETDTMAAAFIQEKSADWAFAFTGGTALHYTVHSGLRLFLGIRYFGIPHLHFSQVVRKTSVAHASSGDLSGNAWFRSMQSMTNQNRNMQSLDLNLGIAIQL